MATRRFTVTLTDFPDQIAITAGNAIWATLMALDEVVKDGVEFHLTHDGPVSLNKKLNAAWRDATSGVHWT